MEWFYLFIAVFFEIFWPLSLKLASLGSHKVLWITIAIVTSFISIVLLYFAQKYIPIGTAYAIWTGLGAACTFIIGVLIFHDAFTLMRIFGILLIISGVVLLKVGS